MTQAQHDRVQREYSHLAKENVELECIAGIIYAFGTELATLRLYKHFRGSDRSECEWSPSLQRWFFTNGHRITS